VIRTVNHLASFISERLQTGPTCRVFSDVLYYCWPLPKEEREAQIVAFAKQHGWIVRIHEQQPIGVIAEFWKR
jgi:hypothetical protein